MTILALALALALATPQGADEPFPTSTALAERVSPEGLTALSELVRSFVERDEIVGAELLVIVNGHTILHEGHGWRDREREQPMRPGGVFCVRSMTKPLIGAATWMLIESGELALDTRAAELLPAFDVEDKRDITVEQLLGHHSGLPMSLIMTRNSRELGSLRAVAELGGACKLEFEPGQAFGYSDQGTDTLAALVEIAGGKPAEDFVRERLLEPLGMRDSACLMVAEHPLRERVCSAYAGSTSSWTRYWDAEQPQLFGVFLGSQGLYSSAVDYARFLDLYLKRGRAGGERLLRGSSVRSTLEPGPFPMSGATGFPGLRSEYGTLMQLWTRAAKDDAGAREVVVFGHTGSDGTHAWAFPESQAMVLYFTQSRGSTTGLRVEERLGELFLGVPFDPLQAAPPLEEYLGYYWEGEGDLYRAIVRDGEDLALEIVGKAVVPLDYVGDDRWKMRPKPTTVLAFDRDAAGRVTGFHVGDHAEYRIEPRADLPKAEEIASRVAAAHQLERLSEAGVVRMRGRIEAPKLLMTGECTLSLEWPNRWRLDEAFGGQQGGVAFDGTTLRRASAGQPAAPIEGTAAEQLLQGNLFLRFGDWRQSGEPLTVIQEMPVGDGRAVLVRAGDTSRPAPTLYVDLESGRLVRIDVLTTVEGLGRVGQKMRFDDWRDVAGALLPFRVESELAHPMLGPLPFVNVYEGIEEGVEVSAGWFSLEPEDR
jgi:CubicO group peptidase (beta-lactamase class C family)